MENSEWEPKTRNTAEDGHIYDGFAFRPVIGGLDRNQIEKPAEEEAVPELTAEQFTAKLENFVMMCGLKHLYELQTDTLPWWMRVAAKTDFRWDDHFPPEEKSDSEADIGGG